MPPFAYLSRYDRHPLSNEGYSGRRCTAQRDIRMQIICQWSCESISAPHIVFIHKSTAGYMDDCLLNFQVTPSILQCKLNNCRSIIALREELRYGARFSSV
jgi:hypothetical protein